MRIALLFTLLFLAASTEAQVSIQLVKSTYKKSDLLSFTIQSAEDVRAEIAVFSNTHVVQVNEVNIKKGNSAWEIPLADAPVGNYFILLKGEKLHEQHSFVIEE
jgi:hypothetical protein